MLEQFDITAFQAQLEVWFFSYIWTANCGTQVGLLITAFIAGYFAIRLLRPKLIDWINGLKVPYRLTQILHNLTKLVFPLAALIMLFVGSKIAGPGGLGFNVIFINSVIKLLAAWIFIRIFLQFIENNFARNIIALSVWSIAALSIFGLLDQTTIALDAVGIDLGTFRLSALTVIKGLLALFILMYGALFLARIIDQRLGKVKSLTPSSQVLIGKISRIFLVVCALLIGVTTAGIDLSLLAVFSGAVGLGIGFGLQKVISNLFSGMLLLLDQSIKPGDIIEVPSPDGSSTTFGWVNNMAARYTEIVTRDNKSYLVPNEDFITQRVVNWSHGNSLIRLEVKFGVHYKSDPHIVKELAEKAAKTPERVVDHPTPVCWLTEFGDSSLNFSLRFWIKDAQAGVTNIKGTVMMALWDAFKDNGVEIPYPHREIFVHET